MSEKYGLLRPTAVGECIYCQNRGEKLTKEHIVPSGLGGWRVLENASCEQCRKKTHSFETKSLRSILGPGRYWLGIRSRKPKERPKFWPVLNTRMDGSSEKILIPIEDLPFFMCFPTYKINPAIERSIAEGHTPNRENGIVIVSEDSDRIVSRMQEYGANTISIQYDHVAFARMLAKIALGYCICEFGFDQITTIVNPLVLGQTNGFPNFVSSSHKPFESERKGPLLERRYEHELMHKIAQDTGTICVRIDLFKNLDAPSYYVMAAVLRKGGAGLVRWSVSGSSPLFPS